MKKQKRLLCVLGSMDAGGAETFLMKIYRSLNKDLYQMDFYVAKEEEGFYNQEILKMGGKIYYSPPKSKGIIQSFINLKKVVFENDYQYVLRVSQHSLSAIDLLAAKLGGAKVLAFRSSNTQTGGGQVNRLLHEKFKWFCIAVSNVKIAPSTEAAMFMFGKKSIISKKANILKNGLSLNDFKFSVQYREIIRRDLEIEGKFVVGHIGRFTNQKNHSFLIEVFIEILKKRTDSVLLLVGKGELETTVYEKIKAYGIEDKVLFLGIRSDIHRILSAIDIFIFPSYFEGMPNTIIEAQAASLPIIMSDTITNEVKITELVESLSLKEEAGKWAIKAINHAESVNRNDETIYSLMTSNGYNIKNVVNDFTNLIFNE